MQEKAKVGDEKKKKLCLFSLHFYMTLLCAFLFGLYDDTMILLMCSVLLLPVSTPSRDNIHTKKQHTGQKRYLVYFYYFIRLFHLSDALNDGPQSNRRGIILIKPIFNIVIFTTTHHVCTMLCCITAAQHWEWANLTGYKIRLIWNGFIETTQVSERLIISPSTCNRKTNETLYLSYTLYRLYIHCAARINRIILFDPITFSSSSFFSHLQPFSCFS